jgi:chemotaxis protein CheC
VNPPYNAGQLDALAELANIGSGNAATALAQMLGRPVEISLPDPKVLTMADAVDALGPPEQPCSCVALPVLGDMEALVALLFGPEDAANVCRLLGVEAEGEWGQSALCEVGNILGSSYLGVLSAMTGLVLEPGVPQARSDMLAAIVSSVLAFALHESDSVLLITSALAVEGTACEISFLLLPRSGGVDGLLASLGLATP